MIESLFILMALLSSWEEIIELHRDGSWDIDMFYSFLFWQTPYKSIWKNFDSKHFSFGLFVLVLCILLSETAFSANFDFLLHNILSFLGVIEAYIKIILLWWAFMYVRNLGLHIIFRKNAFKQWKYLLPINL